MGDATRPRASMRLRITLLASAVTAVAVALAGVLLIRSIEDTQLARVRDQASESLDQAAARLEDGQTVQQALVDLPSVIFVSDEAGECIATNPAGGFTVTCSAGQGAPAFNFGGVPAEAEPSTDGVSTHVGPGSASEGEVLAELGVPIERAEANEVMTRRLDDTRYGPVLVTAVAPEDAVARGVESVGRVLWVLFPGLVGVVAVVAWWLTGHALRPVEAIRSEAEAIGATSLHRRVPEPASDDEVGRLARTMNAMLGRLEGAARRQREFVSDASHELRTPVTAIRTDLEVALEEGHDADWPTVAQAVLAEEARLESLLADLLVLAADDEEPAIDPALPMTTDLGAVVTDEAGRRWPIPVELIRDNGAVDEAYVVPGAPARMRRVVSNLLDNATRHGRDRVEVTVETDTASDRPLVVVHVDDDGPGVPASDQDRIFERFVRLDASRSRDHGGAGLGLAVVRSIVARSGGQVTASDSPLGGARFTVVMPGMTERRDRVPEWDAE